MDGKYAHEKTLNLTSLDIRKMQIKTIIGYTYTSTKIGKIKPITKGWRGYGATGTLMLLVGK